MVARPIVVFGATGHTGRRVAQRLVAHGERPVLAGRSAQRLAALAAELGGLEWRQADAGRPRSVADALRDGEVIVATVGPFAKWGAAAVHAALAAGSTYLDCTGEPAFLRHVFTELAGPARRAGATLLPALGYDYVPGALAGALALEEAGEDAVRVDVGYFAAGLGGMSAGTAESAVGIALAPSHAFRDGALREVRTAERVRTFRVGGRERAAVSIGGAEHFTLPAAYPRLREVNVHLGGLGPLARPLQAATLATALAGRVPGVRGALRAAGERVAALVPAPGDGGGSRVVAEALDASGRRLAEVVLAGVEPYAFTAGFLAWAACRPPPAPGALGPLEAFGLERLEEGCAEAGLRRMA